MRATIVPIVGLILSGLATAVSANEFTAGAFHSDTLYVVHADADSLNRAKLADERYVEDMEQHHRGALTMSEDYLQRGTNPVMAKLARAIIVNQKFEIAVLDEVGRQVARPPLRIASLFVQPIATDGLEHPLRYIKAPSPSILELAKSETVTEYDVRWAKAMIVHHKGALDMARAYNSSPDARNRFLGLMNLDILKDQGYEIAFLERIIARFPGDASSIKPDSGMIHGMPMSHGKGHEDPGHGDHGGHKH